MKDEATEEEPKKDVKEKKAVKPKIKKTSSKEKEVKPKSTIKSKMVTKQTKSKKGE